MSSVRLDVGGHSYDLAVRDGQEARFRALAAAVDTRCQAAASAAGGLTEVRQLLFAALLLADDVEDARAAAIGLRDDLAAAQAELAATRSAPDPAAALAIERLAARVEALANGLEEAPPLP